ncbi:hypothetical protein TIFTF001_004456 [Ficus carica]|uniref:Uncharacterized protein n=1 Tax=Ficus carica TaxID=3494 RepID=A0AA87ZIM8_FICCA|nr:hypothetical protein TIFTF001_004456 [Ficus carica]
MAKEEDHRKKLHIAMFPWLAFGHMIPYLELAKLIAQKGHQISFISTPRNIERLPKLPPNLSPLIKFIKLPLPHVANLPEYVEATADATERQVVLLYKAFDGLQEPITRFLESSKPDWLLFDYAACWLSNAARNLGISSAFFSIFIAAGLGFLSSKSPGDRVSPEDFMVRPKWVPFPSTVAFRRFEILRIFNMLIEVHNGVSVLKRLVEAMRSCDIIAVRSCWKFETEWLRLLEDLHQKPVIPVGQLPPMPFLDEDEIDKWRSIKQWLEQQQKSSVVYVAFGSEAKLSQHELTQLALGLELSELPFLWILRNESSDSDPVQLPTGFEERTRRRGLVCMGWASQKKILAHDSVGIFLSHSGWSSVVEALQLSKALVLLTVSNDQGLNAKVLEEKMVGYVIPRDENDGSFTKDAVAESLKLVMLKEEGKVYRDKAKEMSLVFGDRDLQDRYVDNFLGYLETHK